MLCFPGEYFQWSVRLPAGLRKALTPQARIAAIADDAAAVEVDAVWAAARSSPHLARWGISPQEDDGIAFARARVHGQPVFVAAQDARFLGGSVGQRHGEALCAFFAAARSERPVAVILLLASGGVRLYEANPAELGLARALIALQDLRLAGTAVLAVGVGDVFGGASVLAAAADRLALLQGTRFGLSGPRVIEAARGKQEFDAADPAAVGRLFAAEGRAMHGEAELLPDDVTAVRAWLASGMSERTSFAEQVAATQARLGARLGSAGADPAPKDAMTTAMNNPFIAACCLSKPLDAGGWLWPARLDPLVYLRPLGARTLGPREVHAIDAALLETFAEDVAIRGRALVLLEDSLGHEASPAAELLGVSRYLAQHTAVLALLRSRGLRLLGLVTGTGHSAAFFSNALQASPVYALADARVIAMDKAAIARVTRLAPAQLDALHDDPLLGQSIHCFAQWGGVAAVLPGVDAWTGIAIAP